MKKIFALFLFMILLVPFTVKAKVETTNFTETLKAEGITPLNSSYKENDDQVIIYLFRGSGCPHCYDFLEFLNSISTEYGKKFKLVSYEVYYNKDNLDLKNEVGEFLEQPSTGVPYIVIGDKVFIGYGDSYATAIKNQIDEMYKQDKKDRYDVIKEMNKTEMKPETKVIIAVVIASIVSIGITILYVNKKFNDLSREIKNISKKNKA